jgi:N-acyl-D-aspartate/D-glutamate deacylase
MTYGYRFVGAILLSIAAIRPCTAQAPIGAPPVYDIVIRHGHVLDGAGNPWIATDVAISGGRFVKIGKVEGTGQREIDATGLYVSPGWIDVMDQSADVLLKNGLADNKLREGVTTAIAGEIGVPVDADHIDEYFDQLKKQGISMNFGCYYSEAQARVAVVGEVDRPPNPAELERMKQLMATAMKQGAMGMTTALIYPPSSYATTDELIAMAKVAGAYGGLYASHVRGEGKEVVHAVDELIQISEQGHLPAEIFHLKVAYQPDWGKSMAEIGAHIAAARARGDEIAGDLYMYTAGGSGLEVTIPTWAFDGGPAALKERLADPAIRERLKHDQQTGSPGWWNIIEAAGGWDGIVLVDAANSANRKYEGKSMTVIAKEMGKSPADAAFDLVEQGQSRVLAIYHMMSESDVETALRFSWTSIGSDSGASASRPEHHPRAYGNFPRLIARYVRETHTLTLEDAVRKMTSWPATQLRFSDRGVIREGARADVTIFDYDKIQDTSTYEQPVGYPGGIPYVLVNGVVVIDHATHTGAKPGEIIYGQGHGLVLPQALQ